MQLLLISIVNTMVVTIAVIIHYEFLCRISQYLPKMPIKHRLRIVFGVAGALIAHVIEIWVFAVTYFLITQYLGWGSLIGNIEGSLLDCFYYSFTSYTTLGFGDITPIGEVRYLTGIESLTGLVLITWSASFLFIEMQKHWDNAE